MRYFDCAVTDLARIARVARENCVVARLRRQTYFGALEICRKTLDEVFVFCASMIASERFDFVDLDTDFSQVGDGLTERAFVSMVGKM